MTMTLENPTTVPAESRLTWRAPHVGVRVAYFEDEFLGVVEAHRGSGFTATTRVGEQLGHFLTEADAMSALESAIGAP